MNQLILTITVVITQALLFNTLSAIQIGYVPLKSCLLTKRAIQEFCYASELEVISGKCSRVTKNAFTFQSIEGDNTVLEETVRSLVTRIRSQLRCDILLYEPPEIWIDGKWKSVKNSEGAIPWYLERIGLRSPDLRNRLRASSVHAHLFVISSGIYRKHDAFMNPQMESPRVYSFQRRNRFKKTKSCLEFGTLLANMAAGNVKGIAKQTTIFDVDVLPCLFPNERRPLTLDILEGLHFVYENSRIFYPSVLLLPVLIEGIDPGIEDMISNIISRNVSVVIPTSGSCDATPGNIEDVISVGGSTMSNEAMDRETKPLCIDVYAPGKDVKMMGFYEKETSIGTGTAYSAAIVAGMVVNIFKLEGELTPASLKHKLLEKYSVNAILHRNTSERFPLVQFHKEFRIERMDANTTHDDLEYTPEIHFKPMEPPPIILFKNSSRSSTTFEFQISNYGKGILTWQLKFESINSVSASKWLSSNHERGTLGYKEQITLLIDVTSEHVKSGKYDAYISLSSNDSTKMNSKIPVETFVFCEELAAYNGTHVMTIEEVKFFEKRPSSWEPPSLAESKDQMYMEAVLKFHQPINLQDLSEVYTEKMSVLEKRYLLNSQLCGKYMIRMSKSKNDVWMTPPQFCLWILSNTIFDIYGISFPAQKVCVTYDAKPKSRFYATFFTTRDDMMPITTNSNVLLMLEFSEEVVGMDATSLKISQGKVEWVHLIIEQRNCFGIQVGLPGDYYGSVSIELSDKRYITPVGNALENIASLTFERVQEVSIHPILLEFIHENQTIS